MMNFPGRPSLVTRRHRDLTSLDSCALFGIACSRDNTNPNTCSFTLSIFTKSHPIWTRPDFIMDRSLDEIISERPVRQRHATTIACTNAHCPSSSAAVVALVADPIDAPLPLPEDLVETETETKAPETASER